MAILWQIFLLFTRVALFSWGGGPASLALMQRETTVVGWLSTDEFVDAVALGGALPGPTTAKISAYIGYKTAGFPGALAAVTGTVLPTAVLMLGVTVFFFRIKDSPSVKAILRAVRPVVIGLLLWTAFEMTRSVFEAGEVGWGAALARNLDKVGIALVTFGLLTFTAINPVFIILAAALLGLAFYR